MCVLFCYQVSLLRCVYAGKVRVRRVIAQNGLISGVLGFCAATRRSRQKVSTWRDFCGAGNRVAFREGLILRAEAGC